MSYEAKGSIEVIFDTQHIGDAFSKREFVLKTQNGDFAEYPKFQFIKDKCAKLDAFKVGMEVLVKFNLQGKPYEKNGEMLYFNNLTAWFIESAGNAPVEPTPNHYNSTSAQKPAPAKTAPVSPMEALGDDDLPF